VPQILADVSGAEAERLTRERRPDLWTAFLQRFRKESKSQ